MTDLTDRIAEVLRTHRWYFVGNLGVPGMPDRRGYRCNCGWVTRDDGGAELNDPDAHVAEQIEVELGLKRKLSYPVDGSDGPPSDGVYERWVSAWTEVEK